MRILTVISKDIKDKSGHGGIQVFLHEISKRWVKNTHSVREISGSSQKPKLENFEGVNIIRISPKLLFYIFSPFKILKEIKKFQPEKICIILTISTYHIAILMKFYKIFSSKKMNTYFFRAHLSSKKLFEYFNFTKALIFYISEKLLLPVIVRKSRIITPSIDVLNKIKQFNPEKVLIVKHGVDTTVFKPSNIKSQPHLIFSWGIHVRRKGFHFLIRAFKIILKKYPDARVIIAGNGPFKPYLKNLTEEIKVSDRVELLGRMPINKIVKEINRAELVVIPSLFEGFGLTALEATACKKPVIAFNIPGINEWMNHMENGFLVSPENVTALAEAIDFLFSNPKIRNRLACKGYSQVKEYSWDKIAEKILEYN